MLLLVDLKRLTQFSFLLTQFLKIFFSKVNTTYQQEANKDMHLMVIQVSEDEPQ